MLTPPGWKPRQYSDAELDRLERKRYLPMEELGAVMCRAIQRLTPEERSAIRAIAAKDIEKAQRERDGRLLRMPCSQTIQ